MSASQIIMYEEEFSQLVQRLEELVKEANAKVAFLVSGNGQLLAAVGETQGLKSQALPSLTFENLKEAGGGLAKLISKKEFTILFHEGERDNLFLSVIEEQIILAIIFARPSDLERIQIKVKEISARLAEIFRNLQKKNREDKSGPGGGGRGGGGDMSGGGGPEDLDSAHDARALH